MFRGGFFGEGGGVVEDLLERVFIEGKELGQLSLCPC